MKQYENIPTDPIHFSNLWMSLGNFQLPDITNTAPGSLSDGSVQLLVQITQDALHGASNASALYTRNRYDELKLVQLAQEEKDILSNKNQTSSLLMDDGSQFIATKTLLFSPLYSNYIFFYGMPEYGVGFDPNKVDFIQRLLDLIAQENKTPDVTVE